MPNRGFARGLGFRKKARWLALGGVSFPATLDLDFVAQKTQINLIANGTFDDTSAWLLKTPVGTESATISGGVLTLTGDGTNTTFADQSFATVSGQSYTLTATASAIFTAVGPTQGSSTFYNAALSTGQTVTFTATSGTTWVRFSRGAASPNTVDNVSVKPVAFAGVPLSVVNSSGGYAQTNAGTWTSFAANTARMTDNGLLVEEQRTNLFLNSLVPVTQTITVANATVYTVSLYASGGTLTLSGAGTGTVTANGSVTFTSSTTSLTVTVNSPTGTFQCVNVEAGSFKTSPVATTGTSATRAADVVKLTSIPWFNANAGTLYAEGVSGNGGISTVNGLVSFDDNTATNRISLRRSITNTQLDTIVSSGGVSQAAVVAGSWPTDFTARKAALAWAANDFNAALGGTLGTNDTAGSVPTVTQLQLGTAPNANIINGYLKRVAYWNTRLANATLQSLTT